MPTSTQPMTTHRQPGVDRTPIVTDQQQHPPGSQPAPRDQQPRPSGPISNSPRTKSVQRRWRLTNHLGDSRGTTRHSFLASSDVIVADNQPRSPSFERGSA
jgi:hypothetical protein